MRYLVKTALEDEFSHLVAHNIALVMGWPLTWAALTKPSYSRLCWNPVEKKNYGEKCGLETRCLKYLAKDDPVIVTC